MDKNKTTSIIEELYNNENISLGIHGTAILPKKKHERVQNISQNGLMCRYFDLRRTVAFQDRGHIHSHGDILLEELLKYTYKKHNFGYIRTAHQDDTHAWYSSEYISLEQCSFLIGIPSEMKTTDEELFGDKKSFRRDYATSKNELQIGEDLTGKTLLPQYIIGYYYNGDISTFTPNEKFYGFIFPSKEGDLPTLDLEAISKANEATKIRNAEKNEKSTQELGKESLEQQKDTKSKNLFFNLFNKLKKQIINHQKDTQER